jgi:excisionase family DNA binding protein
MLGPEFVRKAFRLDPLLSIEALAGYLGVPITTIYDWRVDGMGPCGVRVGRHVKFTVSDVLAWIDEQRESRPGSIPMGGDLRWHGRPRTAIGTFGGYTFVSSPNGRAKARSAIATTTDSYDSCRRPATPGSRPSGPSRRSSARVRGPTCLCHTTLLVDAAHATCSGPTSLW